MHRGRPLNVDCRASDTRVQAPKCNLQRRELMRRAERDDGRCWREESRQWDRQWGCDICTQRQRPFRGRCLCASQSIAHRGTADATHRVLIQRRLLHSDFGLDPWPRGYCIRWTGSPCSLPATMSAWLGMRFVARAKASERANPPLPLPHPGSRYSQLTPVTAVVQHTLRPGQAMLVAGWCGTTSNQRSRESTPNETPRKSDGRSLRLLSFELGGQGTTVQLGHRREISFPFYLLTL